MGAISTCTASSQRYHARGVAAASRPRVVAISCRMLCLAVCKPCGSVHGRWLGSQGVTMFSLFLQSKKHAPTSVLFAALQRRLRTKAVVNLCDLAPSRRAFRTHQNRSRADVRRSKSSSQCPVVLHRPCVMAGRPDLSDSVHAFYALHARANS